MTKTNYFKILCLLLLGIYSCDDNQVINPDQFTVVSLIPAMTEVEYLDGETKTLKVNCADEWTLSVDVDWLKLSVEDGKGNTDVQISIIKENPTFDDREACITLFYHNKRATARFKQARKERRLLLAGEFGEEAFISKEMQEIKMTIDANISWKVQVPTQDTSWIKPSNELSLSGENQSEILFNIQPNESTEFRESEIKIFDLGEGEGETLDAAVFLVRQGAYDMPSLVITHDNDSCLSEDSLLEIYFKEEGNDEILNLFSNTNWKFSFDENYPHDWLSYSVEDGRGDTTITLTTLSNVGQIKRNCRLIITANTYGTTQTRFLDIYQDGLENLIKIDGQTAIEIPCEAVNTLATMTENSITASVDWKATVIEGSEWFTLDPNSSEGQGSSIPFNLKYLATENIYVDSRKAIIAVNATGMDIPDQLITVTQHGVVLSSEAVDLYNFLTELAPGFEGENWGTSLPFSQWQGIESSDDRLDAITSVKLNLGQNTTSSNVHMPSWTSFESLESLVLEQMSLISDGQIDLSGLSHLKELSLSGNKLSGDLPILPSAIEEVNLSYNEFLCEVAESYSDLQSLRKLVLSNNQLTGGIFHLGALNKDIFEYLDVSNNNLESYLPSDHDKLGGVLPEAFGEFSKLTTLKISGNRFHGFIHPSIFANKNYYGAQGWDPMVNIYPQQGDPVEGTEEYYNFDSYKLKPNGVGLMRILWNVTTNHGELAWSWDETRNTDISWLTSIDLLSQGVEYVGVRGGPVTKIKSMLGANEIKGGAKASYIGGGTGGVSGNTGGTVKFPITGVILPEEFKFSGMEKIYLEGSGIGGKIPMSALINNLIVIHMPDNLIEQDLIEIIDNMKVNTDLQMARNLLYNNGQGLPESIKIKVTKKLANFNISGNIDLSGEIKQDIVEHLISKGYNTREDFESRFLLGTSLTVEGGMEAYTWEP